MGINLQSLSLTSAFNSIVAFFRSQDNNNKFKSLTQGAESTFIVRLLANIFSTLSYRIVAQARETYLSTAVLPSSNIGISVNLGYSAFRGSNLKRKIQFLPNGNYTFPKLSVIGKYSEDYDILTLDDVTLEEGVSTDIRTVVGKVKEETFTAGTSAIKCFTLFTTGISEDYSLFLESTEVPTTKIIKEMTEDKYLVRTNPYSSVDIMYLNTFPNAKYTYGTGSEITIRYVELADVPVVPYTDNMFSYGTLTDVVSISSYLSFEPVEEMKVNAPLDHETQNLIRSKQDYANRINQIVPAATEADYKALTPTYTLITILKNDFSLLSTSEKEEIIELLKQERYFGTPLPDITDPRREVANLKISLALTTKYKNIADIDLDIENILENYYDARLGATFSTYDLERKLEALSYVKYARVSHVINDRESDKSYQVGYILEHVDDDGKTYYYIASNILGLSGGEAPQWNIPDAGKEPAEIDTGLITEDGSLKWRTYKLLPGVKTVVRENNKPYGIGDYVVDSGDEATKGYMFKCVDLIKSSGFSEPDITYAELGEFVVDGGIVWVVIPRNEYAVQWESIHTYPLGSLVNLSSNANYSLTSIGYTGSTGTGELNFELPVYTVYAQTTNTFVVEGNKTFYFKAGDVITVYGDNNTVKENFTVLSSVMNDSGNTVITVNKDIDSGIAYENIYTSTKGTRDNQILWTLIDDPDNITYPWNGYVVFDHELEIIE